MVWALFFNLLLFKFFSKGQSLISQNITLWNWNIIQKCLCFSWLRAIVFIEKVSCYVKVYDLLWRYLLSWFFPHSNWCLQINNMVFFKREFLYQEITFTFHYYVQLNSKYVVMILFVIVFLQMYCRKKFIYIPLLKIFLHVKKKTIH